jgi:hypothetical protein
VVGPTLAAIFALLLAVLFWPLGAVLWLLCARQAAGRMFAVPSSIYSGVKGPIPF